MDELRPIRCPNCGSQARSELFSTQTLLAYDPGHHDDRGVFHPNPNPNTTTTHWKCRQCGEEYISYTQGGKTYQVR